MYPQITIAAICYIRRRDQVEWPHGRFTTDHRWYADDDELRPCCTRIRAPTATYPYTNLAHCCTMKHVARLYEVDLADLRREIRRLENPQE